MSHIRKKPSSWPHFAQRTLCVLAVSVALMAAQCGSTDDTEESRPCDQTCQDGIVARAVRQTIKVLYNSALPSNPIGTQDYTVPCPQGGSLHITGSADSNAKQGITTVDLSYEFTDCGTLAANATGWDLVLNGVVSEKGTLPSTESTTALIFESKLLQYEGTVSRPAIKVHGPCLLQMQQDGGTLTGKLCKREFETGLLVGLQPASTGPLTMPLNVRAPLDILPSPSPACLAKAEVEKFECEVETTQWQQQELSLEKSQWPWLTPKIEASIFVLLVVIVSGSLALFWSKGLKARIIVLTTGVLITLLIGLTIDRMRQSTETEEASRRSKIYELSQARVNFCRELYKTKVSVCELEADSPPRRPREYPLPSRPSSSAKPPPSCPAADPLCGL